MMYQAPATRQVGGSILIGAAEPPCDQPFHQFPADPEAVYPGGELSSMTEQWTNQVGRQAPQSRS